MSERLRDSDHPYYGTQGCYYVSGTLGHFALHERGGRGGYDGATCHHNYASWADFKSGSEMPYPAEQLEMRRQHGIDDAKIAEDAKRWIAAGGGPVGWFVADMDYNLLYRWDWKTPDPIDYEDGDELPGMSLELFFMLQRKARPMSATVHNITDDDEPEIRAWLFDRWIHMMRLWAPLSGLPCEMPTLPPSKEKLANGSEIDVVRYDFGQALEHAACAMADAARSWAPTTKPEKE